MQRAAPPGTGPAAGGVWGEAPGRGDGAFPELGGRPVAAHQALSRGGLVHPSPRRGNRPRRALRAATGRAAVCPDGAAAEPRCFFPATGALCPPGPSSASAPERPGTCKQRSCRGRQLGRGRGQGSSCTPQGSAELLRHVGSGWQQDHRLHRAPAVLRCWSRCHGLSGTTGPGPHTPRCPAAPAVQAQCLPRSRLPSCLEPLQWL